MQKQITINQTPKEDTWPGGALWDIGVLLAEVLVMVNKPPPPPSADGKKEMNVSRLRTPGIWPTSWKESSILELGCGVGLTGLVGAQLGARVTLLTDLDVVIEKVAQPNIEINKKEFGKSQNVVAIPLCWGNEDDEAACRQILDRLATKSSKRGPRRKVRKKGKTQSQGTPFAQESSPKSTDPSIILIGDVAYQHKPGAPSHFDILMSTLLKFCTTRDTVVMFGTRMRMPASADLLDMFRNDFDEIIEPVQAHEIDDRFLSSSLGRDSMITVHIFKRKLKN
jgi:predicted nicotinamide N-methyase